MFCTYFKTKTHQKPDPWQIEKGRGGDELTSLKQQDSAVPAVSTQLGPLPRV